MRAEDEGGHVGQTLVEPALQGLELLLGPGHDALEFGGSHAFRNPAIGADIAEEDRPSVPEAAGRRGPADESRLRLQFKKGGLLVRGTLQLVKAHQELDIFDHRGYLGCDGLERALVVFVEVIGHGVLHRKHADLFGAEEDGHRQECLVLLLVQAREMFEQRVFRRISLADRALLLERKPCQAFARLDPHLADRRRIQTLVCRQGEEPGLLVVQVNRADGGAHVVSHYAHRGLEKSFQAAALLKHAGQLAYVANERDIVLLISHGRQCPCKNNKLQ